MENILNKIRQQQISAGEDAVIESLMKKGLIEIVNHDKCKLDRKCHRNLNKDCNYYCQFFIK